MVTMVNKLSRIKAKKINLTQENLKQIEVAVDQAERHTSGEIVPLIVHQSASYSWIVLFWAFVGFVFCSGTLAFLEYTSFWAPPLWEVFALQFVCAGIGVFISTFDEVKRMTLHALSYQRLEAIVHEACMMNFVRLGLMETRDRTGVLIYISILEHRVEILSDRGIYSKLPKDYWKKEVHKIVKGIREGNLTLSLEQVILEIGKKLQEHFPRQEDDQNELSNRPETGDLGSSK